MKQATCAPQCGSIWLKWSPAFIRAKSTASTNSLTEPDDDATRLIRPTVPQATQGVLSLLIIETLPLLRQHIRRLRQKASASHFCLYHGQPARRP